MPGRQHGNYPRRQGYGVAFGDSDIISSEASKLWNDDSCGMEVTNLDGKDVNEKEGAVSDR